MTVRRPSKGLAVLAMCGLLAVVVGCRTVQAPVPGPILVAPVPAGWHRAETRLGMKLALPPGWAIRADSPDYLAVWPDPTVAGTSKEGIDAVEVERASYFSMWSDFDSSRSLFENGVRRLGREGLDMMPAEDATLLGAPAQVAIGRVGDRTTLLVVSDSFVVRASIFSTAPPRTGETTENVLGFLEQLGYQGGVPSPPVEASEVE